MSKDNWDGQPRRKIDIDLGEVKTQLALLIESQKNITTLIEKHNEVIYGNGDPGLKTRIDRLEQHKLASDKHAFAAWSAAIGLTIKTLWDFLIKTR